MYQDTTSKVSTGTGRYVPYFYQSGLFQVYDTPRSSHLPRAYVSPSDPYRLSISEPAVQHLERFQTVEQIISNGYFASPKSDPVTAIISDKQETSWLGLDDVISQIRSRYEINEQHLYQIELGKCAAMNSLYAHEAYEGPPTSKQFYSRHKRLQELYELERDEQTSLWKDISRLRQTLPESAHSYLSASRKLQALEFSPGDAL